MAKKAAPQHLRFFWWNLQDYAHFEPSRITERRWPVTADEYREKRQRVLAAFGRMFGADPPEVVGLCELTAANARDLQQVVFPNHDLILGDPADPHAFQIALYLRRGCHLEQRQPWVADRVSEGTRPMCQARYATRRASILFVACHWPAFGEESSEEARRNCAVRLSDGIYDFFFRTPSSVPRHVVAFGDFNEEPHHDMFGATLYASRDRDFARRARHYTDEDLHRVRLYSCAWRHLGEADPHGPAAAGPRVVGTHYSAKRRAWKTYDQVFVTGGLLGTTPPYLDEAELVVRADVGGQVDDRPAKFEFAGGVASGLSDHYPISGRIILS